MNLMRRRVIIACALVVGTLLSVSLARVHAKAAHARDTRVTVSAGIPDLSTTAAIDGIDVSAATAFWRTWRLVTVRYRRDNGEQRFVYANEMAWRAIESGAAQYPDGAMFGKVAFTVSDDDAFPNSGEPRQFSRVQLMRKDARAYRSTGGWGYALITSTPAPPSSTDRATAAACHACHAMVPERDFVFASATFLGGGSRTEMRSPRFKSRFRELNLASITAFQRRALSSVLANETLDKLGSVRALEMQLFAGSVNESIGVLSRFGVDDRLVYVLWDPVSGQYAIARPVASTDDCRTLAWVAHTTGSGVRAGGVRVGAVCDGVWQH